MSTATVLLTQADVDLFVRVSEDRNPRHCDSSFARTTSYGRPIAHGALAVLAALETIPVGTDRIRRLDCRFHGALLPGQVYARTLITSGEGQTSVQIHDGPRVLVEVIVRHNETDPADIRCGDTEASGPRADAAVLPWHELHPDRTCTVTLAPSRHDLDRLLARFDLAGRGIDAEQVAVLAWCSYTVGMELPGRAALLAGFDIIFADRPGTPAPVLHGQAQIISADEGFRLLRLSGTAEFGATAARVSLRAFAQQDVGLPSAATAIRFAGATVEPTGRVALVIGGSRGLGAATVHALAVRGYTVYVSFRFATESAQRVRDDLESMADRVHLLPGDAADPRWCAQAARRILDDHGRLDLLVLNACPPLQELPLAQSSVSRVRAFIADAVALAQVPLAVLIGAVADNHGAVVAVSSTVATDPLPRMAHYGSAKRAIEGLIHAAAAEYPAARYALVRPPRLRTTFTSSVPDAHTLLEPEPVAAAMADWAASGSPARDVTLLDEFPETPALSIAVAASFTAEPITEAMRRCMRRLGYRVKLRFAPYGQVFQTLLDPESVLSANRSGLNWVLLRLEDLLPADWTDTAATADDLRLETERFGDAIEQFLPGRVPLVVQVCPPSPRITTSSALAGVVTDVTTLLASRLSGTGNVHVVTEASWAGCYQITDYDDPVREDLAAIPYAPRATAALGTTAARAAHSLVCAPYKVLVLDADNTLWRGVVAEDGVDGVEISAEHAYLQRSAARWSQEGVIVCVCSKNAEADVRAVFERRDMRLPVDAVTSWRVNWLSKTENLRSLATELGLGLDSFVFIDDNAVETAAVRADLPEVLTLPLPAEMAVIPRLLDQLWAFDRFVVTEEDRLRTTMYQQAARRQEHRRRALSLADFISGLNLTVVVRQAEATDLPRLSQLTLRTNQFNLTGGKLSEAQLRKRRDADEILIAVEVTDRFGDYGTVGAVLAHQDDGVLIVESMLLSCRVLGRGVEHQIVADLGRRAQRLELDSIDFQFRSTARNHPAHHFLSGLDKVERIGEGGLQTFRIPAAIAVAVAFRPTGHAQADIPAPAVSGTENAAENPVAARREALSELAALSGSGALHAWLADGPPRELDTQDADSAEPRQNDALVGTVIRILAGVGSVPADRLTADTRLDEVLRSSLAIVEATAALIEVVGPVPRTLLFEKTTIGEIARILAGQASVRRPAPVPEQTNGSSHVPEPIAVIGLAGRYPGAADVRELWRLLSIGVDAITEIPPDRWDHSRYYSSEPDDRQTNSKWAGLRPEVDRFDPLHFNIAPRDAAQMDPQQRLFLEVAYEAVQDGGYRRDTLPRQTGVYVGAMAHDYGIQTTEAALRGAAPSPYAENYQIANRVSYFLDLSGPSMAVDTACSASGVALALACDALRTRAIPAAIAGGVNLLLHPARFVQYTQMGMLSPRGRCRAFGAGADGIVLGEGAGAVLLKPLSAALADGDYIYGVIRGWQVNSGGRTQGFTVPSPTAQAELVAAVLHQSGCEPETIDYIEAHGTGTPLGDPIEIQGLNQAFGTEGVPGSCAIGSVKSNLGHLESAAAIASLTKVLLQLRHDAIAPSLYADQLNPEIDLAKSRFFVPSRLMPWPRRSTPRRAGLSSFGAGGVNAHLIIEEPPAPRASSSRGDSELVIVSAPDEALLAEYAERLYYALREHPAPLPDVAHTLRTGRDTQDCRAAMVVADTAELLAELRCLADGVRRDDGRTVRSGEPLQVQPRSGRETDLVRVATQWAAGADQVWPTVASPGRVRRLPLPTVPYRRSRQWIDDTGSDKEMSGWAS